MKRVFLGLACLLSFDIQALEYQVQLDNEHITAAYAKIFPHEEIGFHRDAYPQVVVALKGGTITRLEADGSSADVEFPTGVAVFRPTDPENQFHRSVNNSDEPLELIMIQLKNAL